MGNFYSANAQKYVTGKSSLDPYYRCNSISLGVFMRIYIGIFGRIHTGVFRI